MNHPVPPPIPPENTPLPPTPPKNRNWVLFGCGGCLTLLVLGGIAVGAILYFAMSAVKKSDVFAGAVNQAQQNPEVQAALGSPIETGWMIQGSANYENGTGDADLTIPIKGPLNEGTLRAVAHQDPGAPWQYSILEAHLPDGTKINLLQPAATP